MEYLVFAIGVFVFLLYVFIQGYITQRNELKWFRNRLRESFGQPSEKEIKVARYQTLPGFFNAHKSTWDVDEITWNDLSMDDIYKRMNYTLSSVGEECLYKRLHTMQSIEELEYFDKIVQYFHGDEKARLDYMMLMHKLGSTGNYSMYDYLHYLHQLETGSRFKKMLPMISILLSAVVMFWHFAIGMVLLILFMIINIVLYFKEKAKIEPYIITMSYVLRMIKVSEELKKHKFPPCTREMDHIASSVRQLKDLKKGVAFTQFGSTTGGNPLDIIMDYLKMISHVDILIFYFMRAKILSNMDTIDILFANIGYLESAISVCYYREYLKEWTTPSFVEDELVAKEVYHPLLEAPVCNSIRTKRSVLLTGSNASGKSTFLKTIAVNGILAQTIYTVAAKSYSTPYCMIFSSMSLKDNIKTSESYYIVEIKTIKRILDATDICNRKVLCFVDEVLRGTNTVERIAASSQILKTLEEKGAMCFAATHDIELTYLLEGIYKNYHFDEEMKENDISFSYQLKEGRATTRNAIRLLEILGYDKQIIDRSSKQANTFMEEGSWQLCR